MIVERIKTLKEKLQNALHSAKGKDAVLYLMCVCVAFIFWILLSLDSEVQRDYEVPLEIVDVPDSITLIGNVPSYFGVSVQGKGSQLVRFLWGKPAPVKISFNENVSEKSILSLSKLKIDSRLRDYFGGGVQITAVRPDTIRIPFTSSPGVLLPVVIQADVHPSLQSVISGKLRASVDSVRVFGVHGVPHSLRYVQTEYFSRSGLTDTTVVEVSIEPVKGLRIIPDKIKVTIPIEPLILKTRSVLVERVGLPHNTGLITFPARVEVNYLVPMSEYNKDFPITAFVEYSDVNHTTQKAKVHLSGLPQVCQNISVVPDSVEYIIERTNH
ncbi:MAG: hypothetical protein K2H84_08605 [Paramuribaculum sp.]|nr:hypothetical protein [Paramuribaculum sp.]